MAKIFHGENEKTNDTWLFYARFACRALILFREFNPDVLNQYEFMLSQSNLALFCRLVCKQTFKVMKLMYCELVSSCFTQNISFDIRGTHKNIQNFNSRCLYLDNFMETCISKTLQSINVHT